MTRHPTAPRDSDANSMMTLDVCFVAPHGEGALQSRFGLPVTQPFAGAEVQMAFIASGLAHRGHRISCICTSDVPFPTLESIGPIRLMKLPRVSRGPFPAFVTAWRQYHRALKSLAPAIVYQRCAIPLTGMLAWSCSKLGLRFVYAVANDRDLDGRNRQSIGCLRDWLYRYGLRRADLVIFQSIHQQELFRPRPTQRHSLISSAVEAREQHAFSTPESRPPTVLWVGTLLAKKRPFEFLRIARELPGIRFVAAAPAATEPDITARFRMEVTQMDNLEWLGRVPHLAMHELYSQATILLNTSFAEGVPNTFLEAWAVSLPVVSLQIDPDGVIEHLGLGRVVKDGDVVAILSEFIADHAALHRAGKAARNYVQTHHSVQDVVHQYEDILRGLVGNAQPPRQRL